MNAGRPWRTLCLALSVGWCACGDDENGATGAQTDTEGTSSGAASTDGSTSPSGTTGSPASSSETSATGTTGGETTVSTGHAETGSGERLEGLLALDATSDPPTLWSLDPSAGTATARCTLVPGNIYVSLAFGPADRLFAHNLTRKRIETIDPCDCGFEIVGPTGLGDLELSSGLEGTLVGVALDLDAFATIDETTGLSTLVGPLGVELDVGGLAGQNGALWLVDATSDQLLSVDPTTGAATLVAALGQNLGTVGVAPAEASDELWVCSGPSLFTLELDDVNLELVGTTGMSGDCIALAALPAAIECP